MLPRARPRLEGLLVSASDIFTIDVTCPCCGKVNSLTLGGIEGRRKVNCSACHATLGAGQDLMDEADTAAGREADSPPGEIRPS